MWTAVLIMIMVGTVPGYSYKGSVEDIVIENLGVKVEKVGETAVTKDTTLISLVIRLPHLRKVLTPEGNIGGKLDECSSKREIFSFYEHAETANLGIHNMKSMHKSLFRSLEERINGFLGSRTKILESYLVNRSDTSEGAGDIKREKRGIFPMILGAGISLAIGGITEYQLYKINKHVSENTESIHLMKLKVRHMEQAINILDNKVIGFITEITDKLEAYFNDFECNQFYEALTHRLTNQMLEYMRAIDDILWTALSGANNLLLTPRMIGLDILEKVVKDNKIFQDTVFNEHPYLLYSLATIHLLDIEGELELAHFVLSVPMVIGNDNVGVFLTSQVGMSVDEGFCVYYYLPKYLYKKEGIFYEFSLEDCKHHNDLHVCPPENFSNVTSCVHYQGITCGFKRRKCLNYYQYDMSDAGILIRNNRDKDTFSIDIAGLASIVTLTPAGTVYLGWGSVAAVQIGTSLIRSPDVETTPVYTNTLVFEFPSLEYFLDTSNVTSTLSELCRKYNTSLNDLLPPLVDEWYSGKESNTITGLMSAGGLLILILGVIVGWLYFRTNKIIKIFNAASFNKKMEYIKPFRTGALSVRRQSV